MNSECSRAQTLIQVLLDGRIESGQRQVLDRHLSSCPRCAAALESYRALSSAASEWARPSASDDPGAAFNDLLLKMLEAEPRAAVQLSRQVWRHPAVSVVVASCVAIAGGVWLLENTPLLSSLSAAVAPDYWLRTASEAPSAAGTAIWSTIRSLGGLADGQVNLSLPGWATEAGAAAIMVNIVFLRQTLSNRRRQSA